jgi:hypothetical protein
MQAVGKNVVQQLLAVNESNKLKVAFC